MQQHIRSVWQLDLLLMVKDNPTGIALKQLSRKLYIDERVLHPLLDTFVEKGILGIHSSGSYVYAPTSESISEAVQETELVYRQHKSIIIRFIYSTSSENFDRVAEHKDDDVMA